MEFRTVSVHHRSAATISLEKLKLRPSVLCTRRWHSQKRNKFHCTADNVNWLPCRVGFDETEVSVLRACEKWKMKWAELWDSAGCSWRHGISRLFVCHSIDIFISNNTQWDNFMPKSILAVVRGIETAYSGCLLPRITAELDFVECGCTIEFSVLTSSRIERMFTICVCVAFIPSILRRSIR